MSKKRKKNGFTTIELITTFGLVMTIAILLFELVVSLKETYVNVAMRSLLLNKQAIMEQKIYDDFLYRTMTKVSNCGTNCLVFTYNDNSEVTLKVDVDNKLFSYGDYVTKLDENSKFTNIEMTTKTISGVENGKNDSMLIIKIPIENKLFDESYGVNVLYQYNSSEVNVSI